MSNENAGCDASCGGCVEACEACIAECLNEPDVAARAECIESVRFVV